MKLRCLRLIYLLDLIPEKLLLIMCSVFSIIQNTSIPVKITPLVLSQLKEFNETHDDRSNDFVYSTIFNSLPE